MAIKQEIDIFQIRHLYDLLFAQATNSVVNPHLERMVLSQMATMSKTDVAYVRELVAKATEIL